MTKKRKLEDERRKKGVGEKEADITGTLKERDRDKESNGGHVTGFLTAHRTWYVYFITVRVNSCLQKCESFR